jgi:hypothetical protein
MVLFDDSAIKLKVSRECHNLPLAGHLARDKTLARIRRLFTWSNMSSDVESYNRQCTVCQQSKAGPQKKAGLLQPLPIPAQMSEMIPLRIWWVLYPKQQMDMVPYLGRG